jgi:hypothetical protein
MKLMSPEEFSRAVVDYAHRIVPDLGRAVVTEYACALHKQILLTTPVLTGKARANWQLSIKNGVEQQFDKVAGVGATSDPLTGDEESDIDTFRQVMRSFPLGEKVYIRNNLPYINGLDQGTSQKAPQGIVDVAIFASLEEVQQRGVVSRVE